LALIWLTRDFLLRHAEHALSISVRFDRPTDKRRSGLLGGLAEPALLPLELSLVDLASSGGARVADIKAHSIGLRSCVILERYTAACFSRSVEDSESVPP